MCLTKRAMAKSWERSSDMFLPPWVRQGPELWDGEGGQDQKESGKAWNGIAVLQSWAGTGKAESEELAHPEAKVSRKQAEKRG